MESIWNAIQHHFTIPSGLVYTIDSYVPTVISLIMAISISRWLFSLFKWDLSLFDAVQTKETKKENSYHVSLDHSKLQLKESPIGKQYIVQLTEEELIYFWNSLEELNKNLEETVTFDFPSSSESSLRIHLIGGKIRKYKKWGQNFIFLLFLTGTLTGIYLVITEIWNLITSL